jgi:hypothetical protein
MDNTKPQYKIGDILALKDFDGRSTNYTFLEVASFTKLGTPRVYVLDNTSEKTSSCGTSATYILRPIFGRDKVKPQKAMRWYPKMKTYAFKISYGCAYTTLEIYDPDKIYQYEWLSD